MLSNTCQQFNVLGDHPLQHLAWRGLHRNFGIRSNLRRAFSPPSLPGEPSQYAEGEWVQVLDAPEVKRTLNAASRTRGLLFLDYQWDFCGSVYRVQKVMRRMIDDDGFFRPISRTVLLEGVDCGGTTGNTGCGRRCPLMFRDEWVKAAAAPLQAPAPAAGTYKRVRSAKEICATLDWQDKRDGLMFMPEMGLWTGRRLRVVETVHRVFELARHTTTRRPFYILEGLQCSGNILNGSGPCHRACSILWHEDWLSDAE
jgi:hypothetical protein